MSSVHDRVDGVEKRFGLLIKVGGGITLTFLTWIGVGTAYLFSMHGDIQAIKQYETDHGAQIVKDIESPTNAAQLARNLSIAAAQIQLARAENRSPNPSKLKPLENAVLKQSTEHPELPQTWQAAAELASYRTSNIVRPAPLPDCNVDQGVRIIYPEDIPGIQLPPDYANVSGYLFRNCTLHLDHLPEGHLIVGHIKSNSSGPELPPGTPFAIGHLAFLVNCDIVLTDAGVAESDIVRFFGANCRFDYQVETIPTPPTQRLLIASLDNPTPGQLAVELRAAN